MANHYISILNAPYEADPSFIYRKAVMKDVQEATKCDRPLILCGESGTGKSHLALQLAYDFCEEARRNDEEDAFVLWIHARSNHSILASFHTIAVQLDLPLTEQPMATPCQMVADWLKAKIARHTQTTSSMRPDTAIAEERSPIFTNQRYLVVVDGLESLELWNEKLKLEPKFDKYNKPAHKYKALRKYLSYSHQSAPNLIITTPYKGIASGFDVDPVILGDLTPEEAQNMCTYTLGMSGKDREENISPLLGVTLSENLSTNPLIVHLAAANLKHSGSSLQEYIDSVSSTHIHIKSKAPPVSFIPSFREHVSERHKPNLLLAALAEQLQYLWKHCRDSENEEHDKLGPYIRFTCAVGRGGWHVPLSNSAVTACDTPTDDELPSLKTLLALGFVRRIRPGFYTVPHVLQMAYWTCGRLQEGSMVDSQADVANIFERYYLKGRGKAHPYLPMTETVLCHPERNLEGMFHLLDRRAHYYLSIQFFAEAWRDASSAYEVCQEMSKMDEDDLISERMLEALNGLGHVAHNTANYELAIKLERAALDRVERIPAGDGTKDLDKLRIRLLKDYGSSLLALGRYEDTITFYRKALSDIEETYGNNAGLLACKSLLAISLTCVGNVDEAYSIQKDNLAKIIGVYGEECHEAKDALGVWIRVLNLQGKLEDATKAARHWVEVEERTVGLDDVRTLWAYSRLAELLYNTGDISEAYKLLKRARDGFMEKLGPNHHKAQEMQTNMDELFKNRFVGV